MKTKVCMFVTNSVVSDPRVKREASTLIRGGHEVVVIGLRGPEDGDEEWCDGYRIVRVGTPELFTFRQALLAALRRLSPAVHDGLRAVYRAVRYRGHPPVYDTQTKPPPRSQPSESQSQSFWKKCQIEQLAIRCIFWINIDMAKVAVQQQADIFHAHDLDTLLAGYLAKRRAGKLLIYDFHELYTEQFPKGIKGPLWRLWYSLLERALVKKSDYRLTVCDSLGDWLANQYSLPKPLTVMNVPSAHCVPSIKLADSERRVVLFHGGFLPERGLEVLIDSARYLKGGRVVFRGYGPLEERLRKLTQERRLQHVVSFAPPVPMADLVKAASDADIGVIPYLPVCLNNRFCLPNKIFEYMMAGLAVVGSDLPELRRIIMGNQLGRVYDPENPRALSDALNDLIADPALLEKCRRNALRAAQETYNWEQEGQKLLRLYHQAVRYTGPDGGHRDNLKFV